MHPRLQTTIRRQVACRRLPPFAGSPSGKLYHCRGPCFRAINGPISHSVMDISVWHYGLLGFCFSRLNPWPRGEAKAVCYSHKASSCATWKRMRVSSQQCALRACPVRFHISATPWAFARLGPTGPDSMRNRGRHVDTRPIICFVAETLCRGSSQNVPRRQVGQPAPLSVPEPVSTREDKRAPGHQRLKRRQ